MANKIIKVLEYIFTSPLFIGIAIFAAVVIGVTLLLNVFIFRKVLKRHEKMSKRFDERFNRW